MRKVFIILCVLFAAACNKGGSGGGGTPNTPPSDVSVSGVVVHSSFSASDIVFFDRNGNRKWDNGEPSANIDPDNGHYAIAGTAADISTVPLVALLGGASQTASMPMAAVDELIFETPAGQRTISSLTTAIKALMDSNPMLSVDDAHAAVQGELSTSVDIFDNTPASTLALANKVTTVMKAMVEVLADFNISLSDKALMLIMSEIVPQLSNIASDGSVDSSFGGATDASAINNDMDAIAANAPKVMNSVDGLSGYQFHNDSSQLHDGTYQFDYIMLTNSSLISFRNGNEYTNALPDETAPYKEEYSQPLISYIEFPLTSLKAGARHGSKQINFSQGAKLYKTYLTDDIVVPSMDEIIEDGCINASSYLNLCEPISFDSSNVIIDSRNENVKLTINSDGTYKIDYVDTTLTGNARVPFDIRNALPRGRYEKIGDNYVFKNLDGKQILYIFYDDGGDYGAGYYIAGRMLAGGVQTLILFNSVAAKDIQDKW